MSDRLKYKLAELRNDPRALSPREFWVRATRATILSQMKNTVAVEPARRRFHMNLEELVNAWSFFVSGRMATMLRGALSLLLVVGLTVGSWIATVSASYNSLPGEPLYQVKLATEKTELIVASVIGSSEDKVNTLLKHASTRADEVQKSKSPAQVHVAITSLQKTIQSANESLQDVKKNDSPAEAVSAAQAVTEKTDKIVAVLKEAKDTEKNAATSSSTLSSEVAQASNAVEDAGVKAVQVIVEKAPAVDAAVDVNKVKAAVEKKLETVVTDIAEIKKDAALVSSTVSTILVTPSVAAPISPSTTASSSAIVLSSPGATVSSTVEKIQATTQVVAAAAKTVAEAKNLIQNNDLLGAIKKVEELHTVKKEAESAVTEVKQQITELNTAPAAPSSPTATPVPNPTPAVSALPTTSPVPAVHTGSGGVKR